MKTFKCLVISTLLASGTVFAEEEVTYKEIKIEIEEESEPFWEILLLGGTAALDADNSTIQVFDPTPGDKIRQSNDGDWKSWTVQLGLGYALPLFDSERYSDELQWLPFIQPQINAYYLKGNIDGNVDRYYQYAGDRNDTQYKIDFESTRLMFDVALTFASWRNLSVYGLAGIGPSWNRLGYHSKEVPGCVEPMNLNAHTTTNFAYEFGGGLSYSLNEHLSLSAEYLYVGFNDLDLSGSGDLGDGDISGVHTSDFDLNSQAVFLGFRFAL